MHTFNQLHNIQYTTIYKYNRVSELLLSQRKLISMSRSARLHSFCCHIMEALPYSAMPLASSLWWDETTFHREAIVYCLIWVIQMAKNLATSLENGISACMLEL